MRFDLTADNCIQKALGHLDGQTNLSREDHTAAAQVFATLTVAVRISDLTKVLSKIDKHLEVLAKQPPATFD